MVGSCGFTTNLTMPGQSLVRSFVTVEKGGKIPHVVVKLWPDKSAEQKQELADASP